MKNTTTIIIAMIFSFYCFSLCAQNTTSVYISAHPDYWQLFMNPNAYNSVKNSNEKAVFIHITGGSDGAGTTTNHYLAREEGSLRAIRFMSNTFGSGAGLGANTNEKTVTINGHAIKKHTYRNNIAYFLRLPDSKSDGSGYNTLNSVSLEKLFNRTISTITAIDNSTTYNSLNDLQNTLKSLISQEAGGTRVILNTADDDNSINPNEHSDDVYSSKILQNSIKTLNNSVTAKLYIGHSSSTKAKNVSGGNYLAVIGTWGATDSGLSDLSSKSSWNNNYSDWLRRQYFRTKVLK